jgi:hypothetical protein
VGQRRTGSQEDVFAGVLNLRACLWNAKRQYDKAIADYDQAIGLDPTNASYYVHRAVIALIASRDGAERDVREGIERGGWRDSNAALAVLIGNFGERRANRDGAAKRLLDEGANLCDPTFYPTARPALRGGGGGDLTSLPDYPKAITGAGSQRHP